MFNMNAISSLSRYTISSGCLPLSVVSVAHPARGRGVGVRGDARILRGRDGPRDTTHWGRDMGGGKWHRMLELSLRPQGHVRNDMAGQPSEMKQSAHIGYPLL